ncbi:L-histidine N(alpha)-methyltransferase [candidate division KSB1 bacterium]|nr:L-histidine N(alpha)-methyltransferase [candidate division KSB1 bacterium]NIR69174.1 L-histidine N(alpha)-methyltransferase [candidate division KSB1 bacterium]NIS25685.1 L-histidine N(alpha)-methyltransferase [candidate division KSB1 bacterium]NIT72553.1 L-histidine N(alpha)-methyltransferase [candidate division KSB1 bacterium]NIU26362.1 L-histidine N(alpha)-methyltransferase [candidate division KSB1 bacterium]
MELDTLTNLTEERLKVKISRQDKSVESLADDVVAGLSANPKTLPPKYFYDKVGSRIFEEICDLPEYYPTRTELAILENYADDIARQFDEPIRLIELGSGNSFKTRVLIEAFLRRFETLHYMPIDISKSILVKTANDLLEQYPNLKITAYVSDYHTALHALKNQEMGGKLILFLGSNIGNFEPEQALNFLKKTFATMNDDDRLLMGVDLMKDETILKPAYDDAEGVTAKFNQNLLVRLNRELDGDFDLSKFRHKIVFNGEHGRIELHLESTENQTVSLSKIDQQFEFEQGETIHTENSYKYSPEKLTALAESGGFELKTSWFDGNKWFSLNLLRPIDD